MKKTLLIRDEEAVYIDQKTKARTIALPFRFPNGIPGVCMISHLKDVEWNPNDITKIDITFKTSKHE